MKLLVNFAFILTLISMSPFAYSSDNETFAKLYDDWTNAFNHKDVDKICDLFSPNVVADFLGSATKTFPMVCSNLKRQLQDPEQTYSYRYKIRNIYRVENLAAIRITWYFSTNVGGKTTTTTEQGLDVLEKHGENWQIVNWIGYEEKSDKD